MSITEAHSAYGATMAAFDMAETDEDGDALDAARWQLTEAIFSQDAAGLCDLRAKMMILIDTVREFGCFDIACDDGTFLDRLEADVGRLLPR